MQRQDDPIAIPTRVRWLRAFVGALVRLFIRLDVQGLENIPPSGPVLYITNHLNWLDPVLGLVVMPRRSTVFAADKWFDKPLLGAALRWTGQAIPVARGEADRQALRLALEVLKSGGVLGVAPEGTRSKTGAMQKAHTGTAYLASRSGAALLPTAVWGQETVIPTLKRLRRPVVHMVIGEPYVIPGSPNRAKGPELEAYTDDLMRRIAAMLPPQYRGYYA